MTQLNQDPPYIERVYEGNMWHWLCKCYEMDTPLIYGLILLILAACNPSQGPTERTRLNASKEALAPVSKSFQIIDAAFLDLHQRVKSEGNIYTGKLEGQLRLTLQTNDTRLSPQFSFDAHWSFRHSSNHHEATFTHRYSGEIIDDGLEILIPLDAALPPGTYLLTVELRDDQRDEAIGYMHELVIQRLGTENDDPY